MPLGKLILMHEILLPSSNNEAIKDEESSFEISLIINCVLFVAL